MKPLRHIMRCLGRALVNTIHHDGIEHAGYLAFLGLLAFFPFLVFLAALAGFFGAGEVGQEFVQILFRQLPPGVTAALRPRVDEIISGPPQGLLTLAIVGAVWTASSAVEGYRTVLNRAYQVATPPAYILRRLLSIGQLLLFTAVVVIAMAFLVAVPLLWDKAQVWLGSSFLGVTLTVEGGLYWSKMVIGASLGTLFLAVAAMYKLLPNLRLCYFSVMPGAALVVALWLAAAWLFSLYLSNFQQVNLIYGSLGGIIAALLFFYICNVILIYGAEFNYLLSRKDVEENNE